MDARAESSPVAEPGRRWRYRYCPMESGETVEVGGCRGCPYQPEPPFQICVAPRQTRPRRRGFWDREPDWDER